MGSYLGFCRADDGVWFHDIVPTCLATWFTPRSGEVARVAGTAGGGCGQGGGAVEERGRQGVRGLQAVGARAHPSVRRRGRDGARAEVETAETQSARHES